ncbi:Sds3-like protein [Lipomyces arxii]|uniref:Sds3-like protein n=1 Tax=Lipomyces arxii TaxID=56418 RepID=UPI0034CE5968
MSHAGASSKRDKRRHNLTDRYAHLADVFSSQKTVMYADMLADLQNTLAGLHNGTDATYLEKVADLEEERDAELVTLYLNEQFLLSRAEKEFDRDVTAAEDEYANLAKTVRERLLARLESQRRKIREDKELLDIANDHFVLLSVPGYQTPGSPSASGGAGMMGSVGERRKNLRRRGELVSASTAAESEPKKRKRGGKDGDEIAAFWSHRDALPFGHHRDDAVTATAATTSASTGRHREKSFGGLQGLKSDEANEDLALLKRRRKKK